MSNSTTIFQATLFPNSPNHQLIINQRRIPPLFFLLVALRCALEGAVLVHGGRESEQLGGAAELEVGNVDGVVGELIRLIFRV